MSDVSKGVGTGTNARLDVLKVDALPDAFADVGAKHNKLCDLIGGMTGQKGITVTVTSGNILIALNNDLSPNGIAGTATPYTFLALSDGANVRVLGGTINNVVCAETTLVTPANGDKIYIDATISGTTVTAVTVANAASVPAATSTHVYTLLATVAVSGSVATPTPLAWNYSQMQICAGTAIWGGFGA